MRTSSSSSSSRRCSSASTSSSHRCSSCTGAAVSRASGGGTEEKTGDITFRKKVKCDQNATAVRKEEHAALLNVVIPSLREMHEKAIEEGETVVPLKILTLSVKSVPEFAAAVGAEA